MRSVMKMGIGACGVVLLLVGCTNLRVVEVPAEEFVVPAEFVLVEGETLNGFDTLQHQLTHSTEVDADEACRLAFAALRDWGGAEPEEHEPFRSTQCYYGLSEIPNYPELDYATIRVYREVMDSVSGEENTGREVSTNIGVRK